MERTEIRRLVERWFESWNRHDADGAAACYAPLAISRDIGRDVALPDREAIRESVAQYFVAFPDIATTLKRFGCDGDVAYVEWHAVATHQGDFCGIEATGRIMDTDGCIVFRVGSDGLFDSSISYWDVGGLMRQLGPLSETPVI